MAKPVVFNWGPANVTFVAPLQNVVFATNPHVILSSAGFPFSFGNGFRLITLTSTNNLSGVTFTITGTLQGLAQVVTSPGPNNTTLDVSAYWSTISSITVSADAAGISVGSGKIGSPGIFKFNEHASVAGLAVQVALSGDTGTMQYALVTTLDEVGSVPLFSLTAHGGAIVPNTTAVVDPTTTAQTTWSVVMNGATVNAGTSLLASNFYPNIFNYGWIQVGDQSDDFNGTLTATFMQQGIT